MTESSNVPTIYTERDIKRVRRNAKLVGWLQGGAAVFLVGMVVNLLGWIPTVLVTGGVAYLGYRLLKGGKKEEPPAEG